MARKSRRIRHAETPRPADQRAPRSARRAGIWIALALVLLTTAVYAPVWTFDFVDVDDPQYVTANPNIAGGLTPRSIVWAFTTGREANWHPLTWMSHALDVQLFGLSPGPHHVVNLLLHVAGTVLLFLVLRRMTGATWRSAFVAAMFGVHPLHVESVAWVAERKDVLSALFFMLTLGAYARYAAEPGRGRFALAAACLAVGLMAKPMLVTLPMVLLLLDWWPLGRVAGSPAAAQRQGGASWGALVREKLPLLAIVAAASLATFFVQRAGGAVKSLESFPLSLRLQNSVVSYVDYLQDTAWPAGLAFFYPFPVSIPPGRVVAAVVVLAVLTAGAWRLARRVPAVFVGWFWFLGMLVPVIGLVKVGGHARADRFMYLPLIGLAMAVTWGAVALARSESRKRLVAAAAILAVLACAFVAHAQVQYWKDPITLARRTADATEGMNNFGVHLSLAELYRAHGQPAEAVAEYEAAIARNPSSATAHYGLGSALLAEGQAVRAVAAFAQAVRFEPSLAEYQMALGSTLLDLGRGADAVAPLTEAVRLSPDNVDAHWRLGRALAGAGRLDEARVALAEAVRLEPAEASLRNDYGWLLAQQGSLSLAVEQLAEAVRLSPNLVDAHMNLGRVLAAQGRTADALTHLNEAVRLEPDFAEARLNLALTLLAAGRTNEAAEQLRDVIRRQPDNQAARQALARIGR